jgi:hypothetical protein
MQADTGMKTGLVSEEVRPENTTNLNQGYKLISTNCEEELIHSFSMKKSGQATSDYSVGTYTPP